MMQIQSCYGICCRYSKEQFLKVLLMKLSLMPPSPTCSVLIPYRVGLCLESPCTQSTRSLYPQGWILKPPPYWRHWRPWRWSWSLGRRWRSPKWLGEALMTHSVVIYALMVSWYPRRRPIYPTSDGTMDFGPWRPHGVEPLMCGWRPLFDWWWP